MIELKKYVVCEEYINDNCFYYTIRVNTDCNPSRFKVLADFDTYEEAGQYIDYLRFPDSKDD